MPELPSPIVAEEIFRAAIALPASERAAYLDSACGTQAAVRTRVERLLAAHELGAFLRQMPSEAAPAEIGEEAGARFGHYQLVEQLGEGGFGIVWLAEQCEPVQRRVALKIIKLGMDTREVIARFEQERQALALMDHPGIAKVFDAGATPLGRPFFVMELVRGIPITDYCDAAQLPVADRLQLFIAVCHAVQHAHQKGVIHRDLKPSNILVASDGGAPMPKIIDFGVAKATHAGQLAARTVVTQGAQMLGTPHTMSPEQAGGLDLDTRSDIYALGVLLYELLTGRPPFDPHALMRGGWEEMRRTVREVDPPRPSTVVRRSTAVPAVGPAGVPPARRAWMRLGRRDARAPHSRDGCATDLDWIVMKCLEKDRTRRYETANGLALDLRRHLESEPVLARPPSFGYQAGKFIRRHRRAVAAAAAVLVALLAGLAVSTVLYLREKVAWQSEAAQRAKAVRAAAMHAQTAKFLQNMLAGLDPKYTRGRDPTLLKEMLDRAAEHVGPTFKDQPEVELQLRATIAATYRALRLPDAALPQHQRALELATRLHGPEHPATFEALESLAKTHFSADRHPEAVALRERVVVLRRKAQGAEHSETLLAMDKLATSYAHADQPEKALTLREEVLALCRRVRGPANPYTLRAMNRLVDSYSAAGHLPEAIALLEKKIEIERGISHPQLAGTMESLAKHHERAGRQGEARKLREEAQALRTK